MPDSRYSLNYTKVIEYNGEVAGIIITIPYEDFNKLNVKTEKIILKSLKGFVKKIRFLIEDVKYNLVGECNKGDLYVANIATNEKVRGLGLGKALMNYAERLAKENHYERCVLIAKDEETSEFYEKIKYEKVFNRNILGERIIKMAKPII
ncbi:GNAT family N-acetyltransferase [Clostridium sp. MSJ-11]|uniref:GNAT family N-acetyltransferase n=2 Tax=Clostridium mobile TaxID=2841512 RepID=A0ABS6EEB3_9CLOT|nr:GNAT family N-acetyltransferase [Clostridium mobile]